MPSPIISAAIDRLLAGEDLGRDGAAEALEAILSGEAGDAQTAGFLVALRAKGETSDELAGLASVVRAKAQSVAGPSGRFIDTCGTGGGASTFNISTATAFVVAGACVPVAKHGNRSATSRSGSADVLEALGARIDLDGAAVGACMAEAHLGFMFAPAHHPAFKHVVPVRRALGVRTIFNLLGPLTNPAGAPRQLLGVSDPDYLDRMAEALGSLGVERAFLVSARDGLDEVSTMAPTDVAEVSGGEVRRWVVDPAELGFERPDPEAVAGGEPEENAAVISAVFAGERGPARDLVVINAAAAMLVADRVSDMREGCLTAQEVIDTGAAAGALKDFIAVTARLAPRSETDAS
ncbi:MAG: anthranilate phosphoribosyltransferase [Miltoncostaeaceae bacterium]